MSVDIGFAQSSGDLPDRVTVANDQPVLGEGNYVLVILNRALRGEDNPVIDAAHHHARALDLPVVVYSQLDEQIDWANDRLFYFALGAFRECAIALRKRKIQCVQTLERKDEEGTMRSLLAEAVAIYTDEDPTFRDRARLDKILATAHQTVFFVDAARLVPVRKLPKGLKTTPAFRKAHGELRERYAELRAATQTSQIKAQTLSLPNEHNFADYSDAALKDLVSQCDINHSIRISKEHPPTQAVIEARVKILKEKILAKYKWIRNNAALEHSTSQLSPYLHFGMISPHQLLAEIESSEVPKTYTWKFRDEFLTWREWSHYQAFYVPNLHEYRALPDKAKETLEAHAGDPRPELQSDEDILNARTSDSTWNAAQNEWSNTGWLHNNLRMYWSKQILRFTRTPEAAWEMACYINDHFSLDGRDPATYASMQWAFGNAKKGYSEKEIYGWVAPKSDRAILKRDGMKAWIEQRL
ncbi:hypothetical protein [Synechococcus sp. PCC 7335]|uniref:hypothetical protein n=1 Tax=Synechococcus sp. (strain ATCC 29403 / PCC 7335) TaxID=91464 RepID=UPI0002E5E322|nr:hypothetical protein [Synechococcus sp. PCC 7335]